MNKKVLKTMIALVVIFLCACYVLKIFFPEQFAVTVTNDVVIQIGEYINTHKWAHYSFGIFTSFLTYWLYLCAVCRRWYLKWWECLIVLGVIGASIGLTFVDINLVSVLNYTSFIFLPAIFGASLKPVATCFTIHITNQFLTTSIRSLLPYMITSAVNVFILSIDMYLWLLLLYIGFNYKKEEDKK